MNRGLFVTGTGTGVGKTFMVSLLCALLEEEKIDFGVFKPVQTGLVRGRCPDLDMYRRFFPLKDREEEIVPVRLRAPQAPTVSAGMEKRRLFIENILRSFYILKHKHRNMVVEGVGGIMVPLSKDALVIDFMKMSGLSALVVSLPALGTINHTCLTLSALKARGIPVAGIVFNRAGPASGGGGVFPRVRREIERISRVPVLGSLGSFKIVRGCEASIVARARRALDLKAILKFFVR